MHVWSSTVAIYLTYQKASRPNVTQSSSEEESKCECARDREKEIRMGKSVCKCVRERERRLGESVCVCVSVRERESVCVDLSHIHIKT